MYAKGVYGSMWMDVWQTCSCSPPSLVNVRLYLVFKDVLCGLHRNFTTYPFIMSAGSSVILEKLPEELVEVGVRTYGPRVWPIREVQRTSLCKNKWIELDGLEFQHRNGDTSESIDIGGGFWEVVKRTTRIPGMTVDSAECVPIVYYTDGRPPALLIIANVRPPVGRGVLELPAGLLDPEESITSCAIRELYEETGFTGEAVAAAAAEEEVHGVDIAEQASTWPRSYACPWFSDEYMANVGIVINGSSSENCSIACMKPDETESLQAWTLPLPSLPESLHKLAEVYNYGIEGKLLCFVQGFVLSRQLTGVAATDASGIQAAVAAAVATPSTG